MYNNYLQVIFINKNKFYIIFFEIKIIYNQIMYSELYDSLNLNLLEKM